MATVTRKDGRWILSYKDSIGMMVKEPCGAETKDQALRLACELETRAERERLGLLAPKSKITVGELVSWWIEVYPCVTRWRSAQASFAKHHILKAPIASLRLDEVTPGVVETFLQSKVDCLKPKSINHLRGYLFSAFAMGRRAGRWDGANPVADVRRRKVPKRLPEYLTAEEVPLVLDALSDWWRPLFATAIFTGLRKGELIGLRKVDVNLDLRLLAVCRSYDRDTTKGGRAEVVPISSQLVPFLREAMERSPGELVFPGKDGRMMTHHMPMKLRLRDAMRKAGIVIGYVARCKRPACGHKQPAPSKDAVRCERCDQKVWPTGVVRPIRFHSTRHTCASLLMMAGANPASVQRIMRHTDPRLTTEVYGHLAPEYLRKEVDRLQFGTLPAEPVQVKALAASREAVLHQHRMTVDEVALLLGVCKPMIYKMVERGELPHVRISRSIRFNPVAIQAYLTVH